MTPEDKNWIVNVIGIALSCLSGNPNVVDVFTMRVAGWENRQIRIPEKKERVKFQRTWCPAPDTSHVWLYFDRHSERWHYRTGEDTFCVIGYVTIEEAKAGMEQAAASKAHRAAFGAHGGAFTVTFQPTCRDCVAAFKEMNQ